MKSSDTKRAVLASALSLALCCAMLLGTTFAWFTDSVTSTGNRITAGQLKIDLVHVGGGADGRDVSLKETPEHKIFDYDLWEPGYTEIETLRVVNAGSLALKFTLTAAMEDPILGEKGENLADVIDVYVYEGSGTPASLADQGWRNAGTLSSLMADPDGIAYGVLLPAGAQPEQGEPVGSVEMTVALHMQESAGNEYQGLSLGDLNFNLNATQYTYEKDGFDDNQYDAGAIYADTYVSDSAQLAQALADAEDGDVIALMEGNYTAADEISVTKSVTLVGAGDRETIMDDMVFSVDSTATDHDMSATFENLYFTGTSQLKVGFADKQNSVYETLLPTQLTVRNCSADIAVGDNGGDGMQKGQFIYLGATYNTLLDLTIENCNIVTAPSIPGEDASPIVNGNGTRINRVNITGSTFGSAEHPVSRYAFKFARRAQGTQLNISDNTVYGTKTGDKDFYLLDLWQSGGDAYDDLQIVMQNNRIITASLGEGNTRDMLAYIEASIKGQNLRMSISGNTINGAPAGADKVYDATLPEYDFSIVES